MTDAERNWLIAACKQFKHSIDASREGDAAQIIFDATKPSKVHRFPTLIGDDWAPQVAEDLTIADFVWIGQPRDYIDTRAALATWKRKGLYLMAGLGYDDPQVKRAVDEAFTGRVAPGKGTAWSVRYPEPRKICIATPSYSGVTLQYCHSLCRQIQALAGYGIGFECPVIGGDSLVPRARTALFGKFLSDPEATHLMFVDADIEWKALDMFRLLCSDRDVICGVYRKKTAKVEWPCDVMHREGLIGIHGESGAIEMLNAPTGFLMISKRAALKMVREYPERRMRVYDRGWHTPGNHNRYEFFPIAPERSGIMPSEDYGFCRLWQSIGGTVWALPDVELTHHGSAAYTGKLSDSLEAVPA